MKKIFILGSFLIASFSAHALVPKTCTVAILDRGDQFHQVMNELERLNWKITGPDVVDPGTRVVIDSHEEISIRRNGYVMDDNHTKVVVDSLTEKSIIAVEKSNTLKKLGAHFVRAPKAFCLSLEAKNMRVASQNGDIARLKELLNAGADVNEQGSADICHTNLWWGKEECQYVNSVTPLMIAQNSETANFLLDNGANLEAKSKCGDGCLFGPGENAIEIAFNGFTPNFDLLLDKGARVDNDFLRYALLQAQRCNNSAYIGCIPEEESLRRHDKIIDLIKRGTYPTSVISP